MVFLRLQLHWNPINQTKNVDIYVQISIYVYISGNMINFWAFTHLLMSYLKKIYRSMININQI